MMDSNLRARIELHRLWSESQGSQGCQLSEMGLDFQGEKLDGLELTCAEIPGSNFAGASLVGADLYSIDISMDDTPQILSGAVLSDWLRAATKA